MTFMVGPVAGIKGDPQALQQPWLFSDGQQWQSEDAGISSTSSGDSSSLFVPMQGAWGDLIAQPHLADETPMLWQPQGEARARDTVTTSATWLPSPVTSSTTSPFAVSGGSSGAIDWQSLPFPGALHCNLMRSPYLHRKSACCSRRSRCALAVSLIATSGTAQSHLTQG